VITIKFATKLTAVNKLNDAAIRYCHAPFAFLTQIHSFFSITFLQLCVILPRVKRQ